MGAEVNILIKATDQAAGVFKGTSESLEGMGKSAQKARLSLTDIKSGFDLARQGVETFAGVFRTAMEIGKEGAGLEYSRLKFDRLSASINTTSQALMGKLRDATRGMVADSELVASAGDLMALGLAKTENQVVRLTTVSGALGMDMNQLVLTLANQTTMRFDQLGVSIDGFDQRLEKLKKSGMDANAAFTEAFLQQAEAQMEKIGSKADTGAAAFQRLEVATKNMSDAFMVELAPALTNAANAATLLLTASNKLHDTISTHEADVSKTAQSYQEYITEMQRALKVAGMRIEVERGQVRVLAGHSNATRDLSGEIKIMSEAEWEGARAANDWSSAEREAAIAAQYAADANAKGAQAAQVAGEMTMAQSYAIRALVDAVERSKAMADVTAENLQKYKDLTSSVQDYSKGVGGDLVQALKDAGATGKIFEDGLITIDSVAGTSFKRQQDLAQAVEDASKKFAQTGDMQVYQTEIKNIIDTYNPFKTSIEEVNTLLGETNTLWNSLNSKYITLHLRVDDQGFNTYSNAGGSSGTNPPRQPGYGHGEVEPGSGKAAGGPIFKGTTYLVGERGPELFHAPANGTIIPNNQLANLANSAGGGTSLVIQNLYLSGVQNARQFVTELGKLARRAGKSGAAYAGVS